MPWALAACILGGCGWTYKVAKHYPRVEVSEVEHANACPTGSNWKRIGSLTLYGKKAKHPNEVEDKAARHGGHLVCPETTNEKVDVMVPSTSYTKIGNTKYTTTTYNPSGFKRRARPKLGVYRWVAEHERPRPPQACAPGVEVWGECSETDLWTACTLPGDMSTAGRPRTCTCTRLETATRWSCA